MNNKEQQTTHTGLNAKNTKEIYVLVKPNFKKSRPKHNNRSRFDAWKQPFWLKDSKVQTLSSFWESDC